MGPEKEMGFSPEESFYALGAGLDPPRLVHQESRAVSFEGDQARGFSHIQENARKKNIYIDFINGYVEHVHCLISLGTDQTIEKVVQLIKGESSFWINKSGLCKTKFSWQDEYFAVSVSESNLEGVRRYIANQEEHHRTKGYADEFAEFMKRAGFQRFRDKS